MAVRGIFIVGSLPIGRVGVAGFLPVLGVFIFDVCRRLAGLGESGGSEQEECENAGDFDCVLHKSVKLIAGRVWPTG